MKKLIIRSFNMDIACVELCFSDGAFAPSKMRSQ